MNIKNLLGKLSIGRAGVSAGTGNIVRTGAPEDAFRSGVAEFIRKAQTEEQTPQQKPKGRKGKQPVTTPQTDVIETESPQAGMPEQEYGSQNLHKVTLVSRFKYPYAKTKSVPNEDGKDEQVETGLLGWKTTANKNHAETEAAKLYVFKLYVYTDKVTGEDVVLGKEVPEHKVSAYLASQSAKPQAATPQASQIPDDTPVAMGTPEWYDNQKANAPATQQNQVPVVKQKPKRTKKASLEDLLKRFAAAGDAGEPEGPTSDFSVAREVGTEESRYKYKTVLPQFTTYKNNPDAKAAGAEVVRAVELGYRAYEVMPSAYTEYKYPDDPNKKATWTKEITIPTEPEPSAFGTGFRYKFKDGTNPIPALNKNKYVLSELLTVGGEKVPKDPGREAKNNIYEFMTEHDLWTTGLDEHGKLKPEAQDIIQKSFGRVQSNPMLQQFTLGGGALINLGGKEDGIMSESNLLARALYRLTHSENFKYIGDNDEGSTEAFRPLRPDSQDTKTLTKLASAFNAARQQYIKLKRQLDGDDPVKDSGGQEVKRTKAIKASLEQQLEVAADAAKSAGIAYVDEMAKNHPWKLREFILKHPYVGHAPVGDHGKPGGKHEHALPFSPDSHLNNETNTNATYESAAGDLGIKDTDDRKLHALVNAFKKNADNALNNRARTLQSKRHAKTKEVRTKDGNVYHIPVPRTDDGTWSEEAQKSLDFMLNHWLRQYLLSQEEKDAISALHESLGGDKAYSWAQVAYAYLRKEKKLKTSRTVRGIQLLKSDDDFLRSAPIHFTLENEGQDDEEITLRHYIPQSENAEKFKKEILAQHWFTEAEQNLAERLAGKAPFANEDDVAFSLYASWALGAARDNEASRAKQALEKQVAREKEKEMNSRGKPNGWPYALTSQKFSDEERAEFAGNLEELVNKIKNKAGAVIEHERKVVYIKPDGSQVELPNSLPVQLPAGALMPMPTARLKRIKDPNVLAQYGLVSIKGVLYNTARSQPVTVEDGALRIGDKVVTLETLREMTPSDILAEYGLFSRNGKYYSVSQQDMISGPVTEVLARGGEKIALPAETLDEKGMQLLVKYTEQVTGQKLSGGQVHTYESDDDKIKMSGVYTEMINNGSSPKNAYEQAKKAVMREKLNSVAVQCLSGGEQVNPAYMQAAEEWVPRMIETLKSLGDKETLNAISEAKGGLDNLTAEAKSGKLVLDAETAQTLVDEYNLVTGKTPQQGGYIEPFMKGVLMSGYQKTSTPGLPNNKFWHMVGSNIGYRMLDKRIDSESGNDLGSQAMLHLMEKPESPLEGFDLHRILPKSAISMLETTLSDAERRLQRINTGFKKGKRTVVPEWQAAPLPVLLFNHPNWINVPGVFTPEMADQVKALTNTELVKQERLRLFADEINKMFPELAGSDATEVPGKTLEEMAGSNQKKLVFINKLNYATAMNIVLQRKAAQSEKRPEQDIWDIIMDEPGLDPTSPQWHAKHKLSQLEAQIQKTGDSMREQAKLKEQLSLKNMFDVPEGAPVVQLSGKEANAIIDQPMVNALTASLLQSEDRDKISVFGKVNRAMYDLATHSARQAVYPKASVAVTSTMPLMITDDGGKERERDNTGYIPDEYEDIHNASDMPLYSEDQDLPTEILARINTRTKRILGGSDKEENMTFLGQFRQKLNQDLMRENEGKHSRTERAERMYNTVYNIVSKCRRDLSDNEKMLVRAEENNASKAIIRKLKEDIESDTNIMSMVESYNVFEHLAKMSYWGREFTKNIERLKDLKFAEESTIEYLRDRYPSAQANPMAAARTYEPDVANTLVKIGQERTECYRNLENNAREYDISTKYLCDFLTRCTYMNKTDVADKEASALGLSISKAGAENESRLTQDDRNEVANRVFDKIDTEVKWFENPINRIPAVEGAKLGPVALKSEDKDEDKDEDKGKGKGKVKAVDEDEGEDEAAKTYDFSQLTHAGDHKQIPGDISAEDLGRFLSRRGVLFALEMSKLDKVSGRQKTGKIQGDTIQYTQDFTLPKDMAWFVHNWLQSAHISDGVLVPGKDGISTLDAAISQIEKRYAKPGGIYWSGTGQYNALLEHADIKAMAFSLFVKYVNQAAKDSGDTSNVDALMRMACDMIPKDAENIRKGVDYDELEDEIQSKVDDAINVASNACRNADMINRLKSEYVAKGRYTGTEKNSFSEAKNAVALQIANHSIISELVRMSPENQLFVENGSQWAFDPEEIANYIAYTIAQEVTASIKHFERPGEWELVALSPMQIRTKMNPGEMLDVYEIEEYMKSRLKAFQELLASQWRVEPTISDLANGGLEHARDIEKIISKANTALTKLLYESISRSEGDRQPLASAMHNLHTKAQLIETKFQEDLDAKISDHNLDLKGIHDEHISPAIQSANQDDIDLATANAIRKWGAGELGWPMITLGIKEKTYNDKKVRTYGSSKVSNIATDALRNPELASDVHRALSNQIARRLDNLRNRGDDNYNAAIASGDLTDYQHMREQGHYGTEAADLRRGGKWVNTLVGALSLDPNHPLHSYITGGYQVGRHGRVKDKKNQGQVVQQTQQQVAPMPQQVQNAPVPAQSPDPTVFRKTPGINNITKEEREEYERLHGKWSTLPKDQHAAVINRLVRFAAKLDAKGRFTEADLVDSLVHKLEVMV